MTITTSVYTRDCGHGPGVKQVQMCVPSHLDCCSGKLHTYKLPTVIVYGYSMNPFNTLHHEDSFGVWIYVVQEGLFVGKEPLLVHLQQVSRR